MQKLKYRLTHVNTSLLKQLIIINFVISAILIGVCSIPSKMTYERVKCPINADLPLVEAYIERYSCEYDVDKKTIRLIIKGESNFSCNPKGHNDGGRAFGVAQFHKPTFQMFSKEMGEQLDYYSCHDQIKLLAWSIANGKGDHWTTYTRFKKQGLI